MESMLAGPLGETADHIDGFAVDLPALEFVLADGAHGAARQHAPLAILDVRHRRRLAVDDGGHRADAERGIHLEYVAAERAFQVVHVLWLSEKVQVETGAAFAVDIDGVALVEVDAPGNVLGFPSQALIARVELHGSTRGIFAAQSLDGGLVAIRDGHDARLPGAEIDLGDAFVELTVAIQT